MSETNPILNTPYEEPRKHYATDLDGNLNYADIRTGRRIFKPDMPSLPARQGPNQSLFEVTRPGQKIAVRVISQFGEESTKVVAI